MPKSYPVGYKKPPKSGQFKKGKSGNPKGRPKGARSLKAALERELSTKMEIKEQGRKLKLSRMEVLAKRLVTDALNGSPKALTELLRQVNLHLASDKEEHASDTQVGDEDSALLIRFAADYTNSRKGGEG